MTWLRFINVKYLFFDYLKGLCMIFKNFLHGTFSVSFIFVLHQLKMLKFRFFQWTVLNCQKFPIRDIKLFLWNTKFHRVCYLFSDINIKKKQLFPLLFCFLLSSSNPPYPPGLLWGGIFSAYTPSLNPHPTPSLHPPCTKIIPPPPPPRGSTSLMAVKPLRRRPQRRASRWSRRARPAARRRIDAMTQNSKINWLSALGLVILSMASGATAAATAPSSAADGAASSHRVETESARSDERRVGNAWTTRG